MDAEVEEAEGSGIHKNHDDDAPDGSTRQDQPSTSMESVAARTRSRLAKAEAGRSGKGVQTRGSRKRGASAGEIVATTGGPACRKRARSAGTGKAARSDDSSSKVTEGDQENAIDLDSLLKQMETAVKEDNPTHLESILNQGQGHIRRHQVKRAFLVCVNKGLHRCAEVFIDADFQPSLNLYKDGSGKYPLMRATEQKDVQMVKVLTKKPFDTEFVHEADGKTPLHVAVEEESLAMVKSLVEAGFDVNAAWNGNRYPLGTAIREDVTKIPEMIEYLINQGADCERVQLNRYFNRGQTPLMWAISAGADDIFILLLQKGVDVNTQNFEGETALLWAVRDGEVDKVEALLTRGADPTLVRKSTGMSWEDWETELDMGDKPWEPRVLFGRSPLFIAVETKSVKIAKILIESGKVDVNNTNDDDGYSTLDLAVRYRDEEIVELLLEYGADVNYKDNDGCTPFWKAVHANLWKSVCKFVQCGLHPDEQLMEGPDSVAGDLLEDGRCTALVAGCCSIFTDLQERLALGHVMNNSQLLDKWKTVLLLILVGARVSPALRMKLRPDPASPKVIPEEMEDLLQRVYHNARSLRELCIFRVRECLHPQVQQDSQKLPIPRELVEEVNFKYLLSIFKQI